MSELKAAYLFTGDDDVKIDRARKRLAQRAADEGASLETLSGDASTAENFALAVTSPSLLPGRRIILVDGVENWRATDAGPAVDALELLTAGDLDATVVLICSKKPLKAIAERVAAAGGELREFKAPSSRELPNWIAEQAQGMGAAIDPSAARLLVEMVGEPAKNATASQKFSPKRRLLSELEKLVLMVGAGETIDRDDVAAAACGETSAGVFALTDAAVAGNRAVALRIADQLVAGGEPPQRIVALLARAFGQAERAAALAESGREGEIAAELKLPPWLADKVSGQARARGAASLRDALIELARLDDAIKGGSALDTETELMRSIARVTG